MATRMNVCIHVNKSSFKPISVILYSGSAPGYRSPLWPHLHPHNGTVHENHHRTVVTSREISSAHLLTEVI